MPLPRGSAKALTLQRLPFAGIANATQEFVKPRCRMVGDAAQHVGKPSLRSESSGFFVSHAKPCAERITMTAAAPSKLPFWRTVGQAYAGWAKNFPEVVLPVGFGCTDGAVAREGTG